MTLKLKVESIKIFNSRTKSSNLKKRTTLWPTNILLSNPNWGFIFKIYSRDGPSYLRPSIVSPLDVCDPSRDVGYLPTDAIAVYYYSNVDKVFYKPNEGIGE